MNRKKNEKGVALILALILMLIISVMAVSLMFISQTETWASMNYKLMSQARDGAEAGINAAANYLINTYTPPASTGTDGHVLIDYAPLVSSFVATPPGAPPLPGVSRPPRPRRGRREGYNFRTIRGRPNKTGG